MLSSVAHFRWLLSREPCLRSEYTTLEFKYLVAQQSIEQLQKKLKEQAEKVNQANSGGFQFD